MYMKTKDKVKKSMSPGVEQLPWACGPPEEMKVAVILTLSRAKGKDLQFQPEANYYRFFAQFTLSLQTTDPSLRSERVTFSVLRGTDRQGQPPGLSS
jgi:hypothetical protein